MIEASAKAYLNALNKKEEYELLLRNESMENNLVNVV
jgi:hypothetical protein